MKSLKPQNASNKCGKSCFITLLYLFFESQKVTLKFFYKSPIFLNKPNIIKQCFKLIDLTDQWSFASVTQITWISFCLTLKNEVKSLKHFDIDCKIDLDLDRQCELIKLKKAIKKIISTCISEEGKKIFNSNKCIANIQCIMNHALCTCKHTLPSVSGFYSVSKGKAFFFSFFTYLWVKIWLINVIAAFRSSQRANESVVIDFWPLTIHIILLFNIVSFPIKNVLRLVNY